MTYIVSNSSALKPVSKTWFLCVVGMLTWIVLSFFWGERIQAGDGLGWDGRVYAELAQADPLAWLGSRTVDIYRMSRILPSIIVHYFAQLFNYPLGQSAEVIKAFLVFNSAMIMGSTVLLYLIATHLKWSQPVLVLGFVALFLNFPILKHSNYNPTLTDFSAFFFGLASLYAFLKNRQLTLFLISVLAIFVWPTFLYTALPLLIFRVQKLTPTIPEPSNLSNLISALISGAVVAGALYTYYVTGLRLPNGATQVNENVILLSAILFFTFVWLFARPLVDVTFFRLNLFRGASWMGVILSIALVVIFKLAIAVYSSNLTGGYSALMYVQFIGVTALVKPLINVVSHVSYFGPAVILLLLLWKDVVNIAKQYGLGLIFFLLISGFLSIDTESRHLIAFWPVFAVLTCEALNRRGVTWVFVYTTLVAGLLTSRFWLLLNTKEPWVGAFQDFPFQMFFMNFGPWMSDTMYVVFVAFSLILFIVLWLQMRNMGEEICPPPSATLVSRRLD